VLSPSSIVVTGATGQVGEPVAVAMARAGHTVYGVARFRDAAATARLEAAGVRCVPADLSVPGADLAAAGLPAAVDYVLNFAVARMPSFDKAMVANAEATGLLMSHCRHAKAVLHCSSTAVYAPRADGRPLTEADPLGENNHRVMFPTYVLAKVASEAVARTMARVLDLPTVVARLNVPYGDNGGWPLFHLLMMRQGTPIPVGRGGPSRYNPIHEDDIVAMVPALLDAATVPATVVNWGGREEVSIQDWCGYLGELTGLTPAFEERDDALESVTVDTTRMRELVGDTTVDWREGMRRMVAAAS
jgi:UDP-glucuronate 4-epimerase